MEENFWRRLYIKTDAGLTILKIIFMMEIFFQGLIEIFFIVVQS